MRITPSSLRANLYKLLDKILSSGEPLEIERDGQLLIILPAPIDDSKAKKRRKKRQLRFVSRSSCRGGSADILDFSWEDEWDKGRSLE